MLNLRRAGDPRYSSRAEGQGSRVLSTVRFQLSDRFIGSMGEPLDHGVSGPEESEEVVDSGQEKKESAPKSGPNGSATISA